MDSEGLMPDHMDEILSNWDSTARGAKKPHLLYTIPSGQNPTGATMPLARRKELYQVCQKHDIFIIEDEPYYFLQMQPYTGASSPSLPPPSSHEEFLKSLVPPLVSLDVDGRVMRLDSFSKVIAPGTRTGWITASAQLVERFVRHNEVSCQNPSGLSQIVLYKLLDEQWGHGGYLQWLVHLRMEYTRRRDSILAACEKFLPREVVSWSPPAAGMFLWLQLEWTKHPEARTKDLLEIEQEIFLACVEKGVLISPGSWFAAEKVAGGGKEEFVPTQMFFRATFAAASDEKMAEAIERFGQAVRESFKL
jgi:aromatic amino acid aminotransferase I